MNCRSNRYAESHRDFERDSHLCPCRAGYFSFRPTWTASTGGQSRCPERSQHRAYRAPGASVSFLLLTGTRGTKGTYADEQRLNPSPASVPAVPLRFGVTRSGQFAPQVRLPAAKKESRRAWGLLGVRGDGRSLLPRAASGHPSDSGSGSAQ